LGEMSVGSSGGIRSTGPGGEYCRVCRATAEEEEDRARQALATGQNPQQGTRSDITVAISSQNVLRRSTKGGDLDVVAVPYVFRYLCAELASMGIAISLEVR